MKKIKLHSQIVPVQTNKAQVCPHIYDNQPQKKKQKKPRKASAQSRVHSSSIFFFLLIRVPFVLIKHWQSSGGRNVANKSSQILCCCCRVHPRSTLSHPTQYHFSWLMIFVGGHRLLLILYSSPTYQFEFCILEGPGYSFRIEGWLPRYMFVI